MRLYIHPVVIGTARRWEWRVEMRDDQENWYVASYKTALGATTLEEIEEHGARGNTRTLFFAMRQGHRAIKTLKKTHTHLCKEGVVIEV